MSSAADDRKRMVEAKLVQRNTFLAFEPALEECGEGDVVNSTRRRSRANSEPWDGQCCGEDTEPRSGSTNSSDTMSIASSELRTRGDDSSVGTESESEVDEQQEQTCRATSTAQQQRELPSASSPAPQAEQMYYYFALPGTPLWNQFQSANATTSEAQASMTTAMEALHSAELEARAAQLQLAAARLKAEARRVEAQAQGMAASAPCVSMEYWPTWNMSTQSQQITSEQCKAAPSCPADEMTTVMLRNIPNDYTRAMLMELLDSLGLAARYDFLYLPIDFNRTSSLGYAFVNFNRHEDAVLGKARLHGFTDWKVSSQKVCEVCWGEPLQGQSAHVERYRSSPVMHHDVPDEFKPIMFKDGVRIPFPPPMKRVRPPRSKRTSK